MKVILSRFCWAGRDYGWKAKPFNHGEYTYATDGHAIVRVPKIDGYPDAPVHVAGCLDHDEAMLFAPGARIESPLVLPREFIMTQCDCVSSMCGPTTASCPECGGTGEVLQYHPVEQTTGFLLNQVFVAKIKDLPGIKLYLPPSRRENLKYRDIAFFEFDAGCGLIMGCRG